MKAKRTLPPTTTDRRPRRSFETSQKKERDARRGLKEIDGRRRI
jgi:hypothetical protein